MKEIIVGTYEHGFDIGIGGRYSTNNCHGTLTWDEKIRQAKLDNIKLEVVLRPVEDEQTLSIIKPDAVAKNVIGEIYTRFERAGLRIIAAKMVRMTESEAKEFYSIHKDKPFFNDLITFMTSGPVMVQVLEGRDAVLKNREIMGATDPQKALPGTIRHDYATSVDANAVHGSDSLENAKKEILFFFLN